ncbi:hypothetical protein P9272_29865 [Mesorhizobium sp. WSM4976]|uniref:hypothetical protein n=1 Tax=Mesorhizobium sp. WSM4976 TaxID=3038549 RepID=UPI0024160AC4|nr:hypothetical protein [Mesorhizobium sp. WSM4976]MDG4897750.1 hypothetical protein [Mesorhizobium sp. WSM4976]
MPLGRNVFTPIELALLGRVFDRRKDVPETADERERRASRIIAYYQAGIHDEAELDELSRKPLGR